MSFLIPLLIRVVSTEAAKLAIGLAINKLLESKSDGITKEIAETMIDAVAKSKANPTTEEVFSEAIKLLK